MNLTYRLEGPDTEGSIRVFAEDAGITVGSGTMKVRDGAYNVDTVFVEDTHHGRGIGRELLSRLVEAAGDQRITGHAATLRGRGLLESFDRAHPGRIVYTV
jgi:GNAT superfamily N-acetyltransferase